MIAGRSSSLTTPSATRCRNWSHDEDPEMLRQFEGPSKTGSGKRYSSRDSSRREAVIHGSFAVPCAVGVLELNAPTLGQASIAA